MSLNHSPAIVTDGLVLCLDAANVRSYPKSGTTWSDLIGTNDGTLINTPTYDSENGGSILFDGTNQYINMGTGYSISTSSPFSVECWFYLSAYGGQYPTICQLKTDSQYAWNFALSQQSGYNGILFGSVNTWSRLRTDNPPSTGQWHNVCLTYDGSSSFSVYLDLSLETLTGAHSFLSTTQNNYIGTINAASRGATDAWNGYISGFKLYNKTLTADEIRRNYEATVGRYT